MEYIVESSLENFQAWSGGKDTLDVLKEKDDCDAVESILEEYFSCGEDKPTETEINDLLWFERDWIAEQLGYRNWEAYEDGWSESDLEESEDWFSETDFDMMERISGLRREDYSDEDGYEEFVEAVQDWWDGLSDKRKVEVYYEHN